MESNKDDRSYGRVIMDVGKYINNRSCTSAAVMQKGNGDKAHIWELADGEVIVLLLDASAEKAVIRHTIEINHGKSAWVEFKKQLRDFDQVIKKSIASGYSLCSKINPSHPKPVQLLLAADGERVKGG